MTIFCPNRLTGSACFFPLFLMMFVAGPGIAQDEKPQVLVMDIAHSKAVDPDTSQTITDLITTELGMRSEFQTLSGEDIRRLMTLEGEKQAAGCDTDQSCLAELAGAMGARFVVYGRLSTLGKVMVLQLNLFDAMSAAAVGRVVLKARDLETFADSIGGSVNELIQPLLEQLGVSEKPLTPAPTMTAETVTQAPEQTVAAKEEKAAETVTGSTQTPAESEATVTPTHTAGTPTDSNEPSSADEGGGIMGVVPWIVAGGGGGLILVGITGAAAGFVVTNAVVIDSVPADVAPVLRQNYFPIQSAGAVIGGAIMVGGIAVAAGGAAWGALGGGEE